MKVLKILFCSLFVGCAPTIGNTAPEKETVYLARITYYCGQDKWGTRVASPNVQRAKEGITVAGHPDFKFGTKVYIPKLQNTIGDGYFTVQDRGSAVTSKKAAKGKHYVFDVFVNSSNKLKKFANNQPMYMKVYVVNDK